MTDAEYWSVANALPKRILNGIYVVDWRTKIPGCDPTLQAACEFVLGFNPLSGCWIDPGAQYVARPSPYPSPSSWGVSLCNAPITQPPPSGGGTTSSGGSGGGTSSGPNVPNCPSVFLGSPSGMGAWNPSTMQTCHPPPTTSTCKQSQVMVSGQNYVKYDCSIEETPAQWPGINTTFVLVAIAGVALLFFMRK